VTPPQRGFLSPILSAARSRISGGEASVRPSSTISCMRRPAEPGSTRTNRLKSRNLRPSRSDLFYGWWAGIPTIHFVSPSIWAWRGSRIKKIKQAVDRVLCLFPFEPEIYEKAGIAASYVGHPMASEIPEIVDTVAAKKKINGGLEGLVIAVLPGSRRSEIELIGPVFFETIALIAKRLVGQKLHFVVPIAAPHLRPAIESLRANLLIDHPEIDLILLDGQADLALAAADGVLIASGTATLQAALWKKPMVISYKVPWLTAQIMKRQGYLPYVGLPNILCGEFVVPELLQDEAKPEALADAVLSWLDRPAAVKALETRFEQLHLSLKRPTGLLVAQVIEQTLNRRSR
ncbi:MAG: hypothetical protein RLZZ586_929, partial [Pseudomonadota bacterium]